MKRRLVFALLVLLTALAPAVGRASTDAFVPSLGVGDAAFWEGPFIEAASTPSHLLCSAEGAQCFDHLVDVAADGQRLRVALDHPQLNDLFSLVVLDPKGQVVQAVEPLRDATSGQADTMSIEGYVDRPRRGTWTLRVVPRDVTNSPFRVRARLEEPVLQSGRGRLVPNLRALPPFEFSLGECRVDEQLRYGDRRCLRFSYGVANDGRGPLELHMAPGVEGVAYQRIHRADGTWEDRPAGTYRFHTAHLHYHHDFIGQLTLLRVRDRDLELVSKGPKVGFCSGDTYVAEWYRFVQDDQRPLVTNVRDCGIGAPAGARMRLSRGWGDVYGHTVEGNYVPFDGQPDGDYVVRVSSDTEGGGVILETDETDNVGYALVRIVDDRVEVLERGIGSGPFDPAKVVVDDWLPLRP